MSMGTIYTKTGDGGETSLADGRRVSKDDPRVEACGAVDETCAAVGVAMVDVEEQLRVGAERDLLIRTLVACQDMLMRLAAELASAESSKIGVGNDDIEDMEKAIDVFMEGVPQSCHFLLPGVSRPEASLHVARAICRRAERRMKALATASEVPAQATMCINRLSDLLFAAVRFCLNTQGLRERVWREK